MALNGCREGVFGFFFLFQIPHCVRLGTLKQCMKIVILYLLVHCFFFYLPSSLVIGIFNYCVMGKVVEQRN